MRITNDSIIKDDNPILRKLSEPVHTPLSKEDYAILMDMLQYVQDSIDPEKAKKYNLRPAVGISAVQIGILKQLIAVSIKYDENDIQEYALANPKIIAHSAQKAYLKQGEGCLSVLKEHEGYVVRYAQIKVKAYDALQKKEVILDFDGYESIVLQHEIDHLKGLVFYDRINKIQPFKPVKDAIVIE